jgi:hypothetical protein
VSQHRILDLERGSSTAAGDESGKSSNEQVHQEEDHAAPILRTPIEAQIRISDPYRVPISALTRSQAQLDYRSK